MLRTTAPHAVHRFTRLCARPIDVQERLLLHLVRKNADTAFGRRHGFGAIERFTDFQQHVPMSTYADLEPYIRAAMHGQPGQLTRDRPVLYTTTSGTTGVPKYIPMTLEGRRRKAQLMRVWFSAFLRDHPAVANGTILSVVSPEVDGYAPDGTPCGSESGHAYRTMPRIVRSMYAVPYEIFAVDDYDAKYYALLRLAAGKDISAIVTVNPSTVVLLAERLAHHTESIIRDVADGTVRADVALPAEFRARLGLRPDPRRARRLARAAELGGGVLRPAQTWPTLAAIGCWKGGTVGSYLGRFDAYFAPGTPVRDLGYDATELRGSVPLTDDGDAGVLAVGTNVLEFQRADDDAVRADGEFLGVHQLDVGQRYFVIVTTASGLYRYNMNDIVEVVGTYKRTPLIRFVQKGEGVVSFTGEKLYEEQVLAAVDEAFSARRGRYLFIAAVAEFTDASTPRLIFLVEFDDRITDEDGAALADRLDVALGQQNTEYRVKRRSLRYGAPVLRIVRSGEFDRYRHRMVAAGRADGQFKTLRLTTDPAFAAEFHAEQDIVGPQAHAAGVRAPVDG
jgi:hypothetical protein